jgi:hypothetical protein
VWPDGILKNRSALSRTAASPANTSSNAANGDVTACEIVLVGTYAPTAAPSQSASISAGAIGKWTIDSTPPDFQPGDQLIFQTLANYNNGSNTEDALLNTGLVPVAAYAVGGNVVVMLANTAGTSQQTPAGYIPQFTMIRVVANSKID